MVAKRIFCQFLFYQKRENLLRSSLEDLTFFASLTRTEKKKKKLRKGDIPTINLIMIRLTAHTVEYIGTLIKSRFFCFLFFFGRTSRHVASRFPDQGSNPVPLQWKC